MKIINQDSFRSRWAGVPAWIALMGALLCEATLNGAHAAPLTFGTNTLAGIPVEPQEAYPVTNRNAFESPTTTAMFTFVIDDAALPGGPEYTAPTQLKNLFLSRYSGFTSQTVKASQWSGQLPAIVIAPVPKLPSLLNTNSDWQNALAKLGALTAADGHRMLIESGLVVIAGADSRGAFYGAQTFRALLTKAASVPAMAVRDWPDLPLRAALTTATDPESRYDQLGYHHYNALLRNGPMWFDLANTSNYQIVTNWMALCKKYYLDPVPHIPLTGHSWEVLKRAPETAEAFTAVEQPALIGTNWYALQCRNVIDQTNSPIIVESLDSNLRYQVGADYEIDPGMLAYGYALTNKAWSIRRTAGSSIGDGWQVRLTYASVAPNSESYCPSEPKTMTIVTNVIKSVLALVQPKYLHIAHDEIRVLGQDLRCKARGLSHAELAANEIIMLQNFVKQQSAICQVMLWADTMDLHHHAEGLDTRLLINLLPKDLILCHWWYNSGELDWMNANMIHSASRGFPSLGTAWNDNQNVNEWRQTLKTNANWSGLSRGIILGAWGSDWTAMTNTGTWAWSSRLPTPALTNQTIRQITQLTTNPPVPGLSLHMPFKESFDSLDDRAMPISWRWNYTPNATTQQRYFGSVGKSFEISGVRMVTGGTHTYLDNTLGYGCLHLRQQMWIDSLNSGTGLLCKLLEIHGPWFDSRIVLRVVKNASTGKHVVQRDIAGATVTVSGYEFPTDRWVRLDVMANIDTCTWSVWVDGQMVFENAPFVTPGRDITGIQWTARTDGIIYNGYWIDDVLIEHGQSPQVLLKFDGNVTNSGTASLMGAALGAGDSYASNSAAANLRQSVLFSPASDTDGAVGIAIPDNAALDLDSFTATAWLRPKSNGKAGLGMGFYDKFNGVNQKGISTTYSFLNAPTKLRFLLSIDGASAYTGSTTNAVAVGASAPWIFTALTYNAANRTATAYFGSTNMAVYATPGVVLPGAGELHPTANTNNAVIGFRQSTMSRALDGNLDDFRIYNRMLTRDDIEFIRGNSLP